MTGRSSDIALSLAAPLLTLRNSNKTFNKHWRRDREREAVLKMPKSCFCRPEMKMSTFCIFHLMEEKKVCKAGGSRMTVQLFFLKLWFFRKMLKVSKRYYCKLVKVRTLVILCVTTDVYFLCHIWCQIVRRRFYTTSIWHFLAWIK